MSDESATETSTPAVSPRVALNQSFWAANDRKKASKPQKRPDGTEVGDVRQFLAAAREIIAVRRQIQALPSEEDHRLSEAQVNVYFWAVYAVATKSDDLHEALEQTQQLAKIYDHRLRHGWQPDDFSMRGQAGLLVSLARKIERSAKSEGGNRKPIPYQVACAYMQLAERNCAFLTNDDFTRRPLTAEERQRLTPPGGKRLRLKAWPSNVEKIVGLAARCVKDHANTPSPIVPGENLVVFVGKHLEAGEWFGYYYARWLTMLGRYEEAATHLRAVVSAKKQEMWPWMHLAETYAQDPEKARACYCRALLCEMHDRDIAEQIARKIHLRLNVVLQALGETEAAQREMAFAHDANPLPGAREDYRKHAGAADRLLLDPKRSRAFEGLFEKRADQAFGFVRVGGGRGDSIFVPPPLTKSLGNGMRVKGYAVLRMDRKKNRESWTAEIIERIVKGGA